MADESQTSDVESIRRRPGMYVGATDQHGVHHMFYWVLDDLLDNIRAGRGRALTVIIRGPTCEIWDDGPPLPPGDGPPLLRLDEATETFGPELPPRGVAGAVQTRSYLPVLRALSSALRVSFLLEGMRYHRLYKRGVQLDGGYTGTDGPLDGRHPGMRFQAAFVPDPDVFGDAQIDVEHVRHRLRVAAATCPDADIRLGLGDDASNAPVEMEKIRMPGGMADMLPEIHGEPDHGTVPKVPFRLVVRSGEYAFDVAIRWHTTVRKTSSLGWVTAWANTVHTREGAHVLGLREAVRDAGLGDVAWKATLSVFVPQPRFSSPVKDVLHSPEIRRMIRDQLTPALERLHEDDDFAMALERGRQCLEK